MKKIFIYLTFVMFTNLYVQAQTNLNIPKALPTTFGNKFTFELGSKILIELKEVGNGKYDYKVISIEKITDYYSFAKNENLFEKKPKENTVEIFFMGAYSNDGSKDKDWNTLLMLRNNSKKHITYKADIKYYFSDTFENTSIVGAFPGTNTNEIWSHKIDFITLYDFENLILK